MVQIVAGLVSDKWEQVEALLQEHWQELARNKSVMVLKPDVERYRQLEASGALIALFAYDGDVIVGYSVCCITRHLHYADLTMATNDVLFVTKSHRHGRTGLQLIAETEAYAKLRGAQLMVWHAKQHTQLEVILPRLGYAVQEIAFSKVLP